MTVSRVPSQTTMTFSIGPLTLSIGPCQTRQQMERLITKVRDILNRLGPQQCFALINQVFHLPLTTATPHVVLDAELTKLFPGTLINNSVGDATKHNLFFLLCKKLEPRSLANEITSLTEQVFTDCQEESSRTEGSQGLNEFPFCRSMALIQKWNQSRPAFDRVSFLIQLANISEEKKVHYNRSNRLIVTAEGFPAFNYPPVTSFIQSIADFLKGRSQQQLKGEIFKRIINLDAEAKDLLIALKSIARETNPFRRTEQHKKDLQDAMELCNLVAQKIPLAISGLQNLNTTLKQNFFLDEIEMLSKTLKILGEALELGNFPSQTQTAKKIITASSAVISPQKPIPLTKSQQVLMDAIKTLCEFILTSLSPKLKEDLNAYAHTPPNSYAHFDRNKHFIPTSPETKGLGTMLHGAAQTVTALFKGQKPEDFIPIMSGEVSFLQEQMHLISRSIKILQDNPQVAQTLSCNILIMRTSLELKPLKHLLREALNGSVQGGGIQGLASTYKKNIQLQELVISLDSLLKQIEEIETGLAPFEEKKIPTQSMITNASY